MAADNTPFGSYGEFQPVPDDVDWAAHDAEADAYFAAMNSEDDLYADPQDLAAMADYFEQEAFNPVDQGFFDDDPSPYDGNYSEM